MSTKRKFPWRPLDDRSRQFIETRLTHGHSPSAIRDAYNAFVQLTPEQIATRFRNVGGEVQVTKNKRMRVGGQQPWQQLSGLPPVNIEDVRRIYDNLRKSKGNATFNHIRKEYLESFIDSDRRLGLRVVRLGQKAFKSGVSRRASDAGMLYKITADPLLKDEFDVLYHSERQY